MTTRKYVFYTLFGIAGMLGIMGLFIYLFDPCSYFRLEDGKLKYVASAYIDAGIIRNADYDSAIIGSSVSQNFDVALMREKLGVNPVKINTGGISLEQRDLFYHSLEQRNKANKYYVELALTTFNDTTDDLSDTPTYLYDDDCLNDYRYLYGYETWLRAVPIALAYQVLDKCNIYIDTMNNLEIDHVGDWYYRKPVGEEIIKNNYSRGIDAVSLPNQQMMYERMKENVDTKLTTIINENNEYVFYWPPYSILFWYDVQNGGYLETYLNIKEYINQTLLQYPNVRVYDFQYDQRIMDLNHYRDTVHYGKELNDWMVECFSNEEYMLDNLSVLYGTEEIQNRLVEFQDQDLSWMKK